MAIVVDSTPILELWDEVQPLMQAHRLSGYDAGYLALAKRLGLPLATMDEQLARAARAEECLWRG